MSSQIKLADTVYPHFGTSSPTTGDATDADSLPTVTIEEDGVALGYAPAVSHVTAGVYRVTIVASGANGFEVGKRYSAWVQATVEGVTGRDSLIEFEVVSQSLSDIASDSTTVLAAWVLPATKEVAPLRYQGFPRRIR
jgi:hypothetical protein